MQVSPDSTRGELLYVSGSSYVSSTVHVNYALGVLTYARNRNVAHWVSNLLAPSLSFRQGKQLCQ